MPVETTYIFNHEKDEQKDPNLKRSKDGWTEVKCYEIVCQGQSTNLRNVK